MQPEPRDPGKVDPLSNTEEQEPAEPLKSVPPGKKPNATNATIPGTGRVVTDVDGNEVKRVVRT